MKRTPLKQGVSKKGNAQIKLDEITYKEVFDKSNHHCEECGSFLGDVFSYLGKVLNRWRYSHILPKGLYGKCRNDARNFNNLCLLCHQKWEFGKKEDMIIYEKNLITIEILKNEHGY